MLQAPGVARSLDHIQPSQAPRGAERVNVIAAMMQDSMFDEAACGICSTTGFPGRIPA